MRARMMFVAGAALLLAVAPGAAARAQQTADTSGWGAVVLPQTEAIAALATGVAVGPDAIVAVGQRACEWRDRKTADIGRCWGQPWVSLDGIDREAVEARTSGLDLGRFTMTTSGPELGVEGVAYGPGGFVAYGWAKPVGGAARDAGIAPTLWRSDDGRAWERIPAPESFAGEHLMGLGPWLNDMVGTEAGYLLAGTTFGTPAPRAAIWSSPDGLTWTLAEDGDAFDIGRLHRHHGGPGAGGITAIAVEPAAADFGGAIAVGTACPAAQEGAGPRGGDWRTTYDWTTGNCWAQYWRTDDGVSWEASTFEPAEGGVLPDEIRWADDVATDGDRTIVGTNPRLVLHTDDGSTWDVADGDKVGRQEALATSTAGFHALVPKCEAAECRRQALTLWSSPDGADWDLTPTQPTMPSGAEDFITVDAVSFGDRILATAGYWTAPRGDLASMVLLSPPLATVPTRPSLDAVISVPPANAAPLPDSVAVPAGSIAYVTAADTTGSWIREHVIETGADSAFGKGFEVEWRPDPGDATTIAYTVRGAATAAPLSTIRQWGCEKEVCRDRVLVRDAWRPRFSPDGTAIAFSRSVVDLGDAWVRDLRDSQTTRLPGGEPEWSPTGEWLLVLKEYVDDLAVAAAVVRPDGSDERVLGPGWNATWSPDGRKVASTWTEGDVTTVSAVDIGSGATEELFAVEGGIAELRWLPGDTVAFVRGDHDGGDLYAIDLADKSVTSLTANLVVKPDLAVSPDGAWLAFSATPTDADAAEAAGIYLASRDGGWRPLVTGVDASAPAWRPEVMPAG